MTDKVVDASAIAAMVFFEPHANQVDKKLVGCRLFAPILLPFEMMNVCVKKIRARPDRRDALYLGFRNFQRAAIELRDIDLERVIEVAERNNLSAYDASYLWLARHLGVELVTLDDRLERAWARSS